jgi:hypothetical protein
LPKDLKAATAKVGIYDREERFATGAIHAGGNISSRLRTIAAMRRR